MCPQTHSITRRGDIYFVVVIITSTIIIFYLVILVCISQHAADKLT